MSAAQLKDLTRLQQPARAPAGQVQVSYGVHHLEVAVRRLDSGTYQAAADGWEIVWPLLGDLLYRLQVSSGELQIAFDDHGARKYAPELLISFAWLYLNALLRECRQVDPSLPSLSRYL